MSDGWEDYDHALARIALLDAEIDRLRSAARPALTEVERAMLSLASKMELENRVLSVSLSDHLPDHLAERGLMERVPGVTKGGFRYRITPKGIELLTEERTPT